MANTRGPLALATSAGAASAPEIGVEDHRDYHRPGDAFEHIPQAFFANTASLIVDTAVVLDQHLDEVKADR